MVSVDRAKESLKNSLAALYARVFADWRIMPPREWAETVRRQPGEHGSVQPFTFDYAPYQREMYDEVFNPRNHEVIYQLASRLGKSATVQNALGYKIHQAPCRIGVMWPTLGQAKKWSKDDFMGELVEPTPELADLIGDDSGRRKSDNTLLHKIFLGGLIDMVGANTPGDLRRMKFRFGYGDEIDAIDEHGSDEGSILDIFKKRGSEYPDTTEVYCSYPSFRGRSRIEAKLLESDYRQWKVTCLICGGEPYVMHRNQLRYSVDQPQDARLECPRCKGHLTDAQRYAMMMGGDPKKPRFDLWKPTKEFRGKAGFQANSMLWPHPVEPLKFPGGYLQIIAQAEIDAEKSDNPQKSRRVIVNTVDSETFVDECDAKPEHSKLFLRREDYDPAKMLPAGVLWIGFFVDVQKDRLELFIDGYGLKNQSWALDYQVINGSPLSPPNQGCWAELDRILLQANYPHPCGQYLRISGGQVDCGNWPDNVYAFTRPRASRGISASRGASSLCKPIIERKARREGNPPARVWHIGTNEAKDIIYQRLDLDNKEANGYRHYPALGQFSEQFFKMLTAEDSEMKKAGDGKWYRAFSCEQGVRNEALDGAVGTMAAVAIHRPKFAKLAIELEVKISEDGKTIMQVPDGGKPTKEPTPRPTRSFVSRGFSKGSAARTGGFVQGWR